MSKTVITQLLYLFDEAFEGKDWHSLLSNVQSVTAEDWLWVAPNGRRSIRDIVGHIGSCKIVYHNQAFGDGLLRWEDPFVQGVEALTSIPSAITWLREGHARLRQSFAALEDDGLLQLRPHHSGKLKETRWILSTMLQHDLYHAGEINYIRALHQQNDD